jgi:hypothetical protein
MTTGRDQNHPLPDEVRPVPASYPLHNSPNQEKKGRIWGSSSN